MGIIYKFRGPTYTLERRITLFAWIVNAIFSGYFLTLAFNYYSLVYRYELELPQRPNFYWPFLIYSSFAIINFLYWHYLTNKMRRKEYMQFSLIYSVILLVLPFAIFEIVGSYFLFWSSHRIIQGLPPLSR